MKERIIVGGLMLGLLGGCPIAEQENFVPSTVYTMMQQKDIDRFSYRDPHYSMPEDRHFKSFIGPVSSFNLPDGRTFIYNGGVEQGKFIIDNNLEQEGDETQLTLVQGDELFVGFNNILRVDALSLEMLVNPETREEHSIEKAVVILLERQVSIEHRR